MKDTTDTSKFASYIHLRIGIKSEGRLRTFMTKKIMLIFYVWTFHLYVATFHLHLHMRYISLSLLDIPVNMVSYQDILDRGLLLTRKLLNQGFLRVKVKSLFRKFCGRHYDLVNRHETSVPSCCYFLVLISAAVVVSKPVISIFILVEIFMGYLCWIVFLFTIYIRWWLYGFWLALWYLQTLMMSYSNNLHQVRSE
jgi:hypothetical protein